MLLTILDFAGWKACGQQFLWTFGLCSAVVFGLALLAWWREDTESYEPWEFSGLITLVLHVAGSLLTLILTPDRWWLRLVSWVVVGGPLVLFLDRILPSLFGALATLGLVIGIKHLLTAGRHSQGPPSS